MGWKEPMYIIIALTDGCRNPLSLDMGWKENFSKLKISHDQSQSAFAGYGLKSKDNSRSSNDGGSRNPLSLDMGWKVKLQIQKENCMKSRNPLSLDMGWKEDKPYEITYWNLGRNPLSLDMGWKGRKDTQSTSTSWSQSAFAGYGLKSQKKFTFI